MMRTGPYSERRVKEISEALGVEPSHHAIAEIVTAADCYVEVVPENRTAG